MTNKNMNKKVDLILCIMILCSCFYSAISSARLGLGFASGVGVESIVPYRLAISWEFDRVWPKIDDPRQWGLNINIEGSFAHWQGKQKPEYGLYGPDNNDQLRAITLGPVFRWQRKDLYSNLAIAPYVELAVGASWLSRRVIGGRRLSLHYQFEDNFGLGARFGKRQQYDITLRGFHYSNASIKRPNSGVNLAMLSLAYWFGKPG